MSKAEPATDELIAEIEAALKEEKLFYWHHFAALIARIREQEKAMDLVAKTHLLQVKMECAERDATIKRMDEALKPFAELADRYDPPEGDDDDMAWEATACPTVGQLRAARAARKEPT